ncbi:hypothetical protein D3C73_1548340 [compost metagenome]
MVDGVHLIILRTERAAIIPKFLYSIRDDYNKAVHIYANILVVLIPLIIIEVCGI